MKFLRYFLKWFMAHQYFTEVLLLVSLRSLSCIVWLEIMSTLIEGLSRECRSTLSGISAPFYHSISRKHCSVMITHCFCAVQEKTVAKILLTTTSFLPAPWNSSSVYRLPFFLHHEAISFQQRLMLLERSHHRIPEFSLLLKNRWIFAHFFFQIFLISSSLMKSSFPMIRPWEIFFPQKCLFDFN